MIRIIADVNVGKKLIVQLGHLAQKLSLYFLFRDIARIEECNQVAAFRILVEPEIRPAPEDSAVLALAQIFKIIIIFSGRKFRHHIYPVKGGSQVFAIFRFRSGGRQFPDCLLIGFPLLRDSGGFCGMITLDPVLRNIDPALDTSLG